MEFGDVIKYSVFQKVVAEVAFASAAAAPIRVVATDIPLRFALISAVSHSKAGATVRAAEQLAKHVGELFALPTVAGRSSPSLALDTPEKAFGDCWG